MRTHRSITSYVNSSTYSDCGSSTRSTMKQLGLNARAITSHRGKTTTSDSGVDPIIISGQACRHSTTTKKNLLDYSVLNKEQHIHA